MHFIELNKFNKDFKDIKTSLDRWVSFLNRAYEIDADKIPKELEEDENIKKAIEKLDIMYLDKEEREIYENDLKALRIHKAEIKTAEEKVVLRVVENLLKKEMKIEDIALAAGILVEKVIEIKNKYQH